MGAWKLRSRSLPLDRTLLVGVLNVTPDSFSDGGMYLDTDRAVEHGLRMADEGADLVDVGGESTRPGAEEVPAEVEIARAIPVVESLTAAGLAVSIDTTKPAVARAALEAGAEVVNDVSGMGDPEMRALCAEAGCGVVVMHMQGNPRTMQLDPRYEDVVEDVRGFLRDRAAQVIEAGLDPACVCVDPGIGFGKNLDHNLELLRNLGRLADLGHPLMVGTSRKSFLGRITGVEDPAARDLATAVTVALAVERGAHAVRVHDVAAAREAALVARAIVRPGATC